MRIRTVNSIGQELTTVHQADGPHEADPSQVVFRRTLSALSEEQCMAYRMQLMDSIERQGERLTGKVDIKEFVKYRALIKDLFDDIVSNGYSFQRDNALEARGRHRFFATVRTVDEKLDRMAKEVLSGQADQISLLQQVGEIRGMLLDLML